MRECWPKWPTIFFGLEKFATRAAMRGQKNKNAAMKTFHRTSIRRESTHVAPHANNLDIF
jgi:hypothetical protein